MEAAGLLRYLYEREYGIHNRAEQRAIDLEEARLAVIYRRQRHLIPVDPNYVEATDTET